MTLGRTNVEPTEGRRETQANAAGGLRLAFLVSPLRSQCGQCETVKGSRYRISLLTYEGSLMVLSTMLMMPIVLIITLSILEG